MNGRVISLDELMKDGGLVRYDDVTYIRNFKLRERYNNDPA